MKQWIAARTRYRTSLQKFVLPITTLLLPLLLALPLLAQDTPPDDTGGGLDPITTPAPLPTREPRPSLYAITNDDRAQLQFYFFNTLPQGETRLARVIGNDIQDVTAQWQGRAIPFMPLADGFYGLLSAEMEAQTGPNPLIVTMTYADGTQSSLSAPIEIVQGGFITQDVNIPADRGYLLDVQTERAELARLESLIEPITPERYWDETGFQLPISAALTSPFGAFRSFNGTLNTRHTGWDIRTTLGNSVMAMAAGEVIFSGYLPIRGNYILIDHGYGVYSGYGHCSEVFAEDWDQVEKGQVLCLTGNTGRTSGPHFHWEVSVNGNWIDSVQLLEMWMP